MKIYSILMICISFFISCDNRKQYKNEFLYVNAKALRLRANPSTNAESIMLLKNKEMIIPLMDTGKFSTIDNFKTNWVKIKTIYGKIGYVFKKYLSKYKVDKKTKKFSFIGRWSAYSDPPNSLFYFYKNNKFKLETISGYNQERIFDYGTYKFDKKNKIFVKTRKKIKMLFVIVNNNNTTTLKLGNFIFKKDLFLPSK